MFTFIAVIFGVLLVGLGLSGQLGKVGVLFRGFAGMFVEDIAKTPKGAEAIYNQAIEKTENEYNTAATNLRKVAGQLRTAQDKLKESEKRLTKAEQTCESLAQQGRLQEAGIYAQDRMMAIAEKEAYLEAVNKLTEMYHQVEDACTKLEAMLKQLRSEKDSVISRLTINKQVAEIYQQIDGIQVNNVDKMIGHVKQGLKDSTEIAVGSKAVHDSRLSTKMDRIDQSIMTDDYLKSLQAKYKK